MTVSLRTLAMLIVVSCIAADKKNENAQTDQEKLQGTWQVASSYDESGQPNAVKDVRFVFTQASLEIMHGKDNPMGVKYTLDSTAKPKQIDLLVEHEGKTSKQPGIYLLEEDALKVRLAASGQPRPSDFVSKAGLFVLKRVEKQAK